MLWTRLRRYVNVLITLAILAVLLYLFTTNLTARETLIHIFSYSETWQLPYDIARTMLRMVVAFAFVLAFGLSYGIAAGLNRKLSNILIPILDVLQSVPVLGYMPIAILFFARAFQGSELGFELVSILLIFTGMAWAVTFGVISGVRTIPHELTEAANLFGLKGWKYLRHVVFPAIYPSLISGSILAWGGGWYFLVACEYIQYGTLKYALPGLGSFLMLAAYKYGDIALNVFGLIIFVVIILIIDRVIWHTLMQNAEKYKYEY
jgi:NitT/TauT family transport system permease protein